MIEIPIVPSFRPFSSTSLHPKKKSTTRHPMALHGVIGTSSCLNCRAKKVRCDRVLPRCWPCALRNLECVTPEAPPRMIWLRPWVMYPNCPAVQETEPAVENVHGRRQLLFSREEQAENAAHLVSLVGESDIGSVLDGFDDNCEEIQLGEILSHGPFHAFRCAVESDMPICSPPSIATDLLDFADIADWRLFSPEITQMIDQDILQLPCPPLPQVIEEELAFTEQAPEGSPSPEETKPIEKFTSAMRLPPAMPLEPLDDLGGFSMSTARLLLDHYRNTMMSFFAPARAERKSPWEILYIPSVMSTLGDITLTGDSGNSKISLLFATFAISAYSMASLSVASADQDSQDWYGLGELYKRRTVARLQKSLNDLSVGRLKKEKYKDILMPLLSMVTISVVSGNMANATLYLRDIERFITIHGRAKKRKSRKVQMLHSIYLYLRVLTETANPEDRVWEDTYTEAVLNSSGAHSHERILKWDVLIGTHPGIYKPSPAAPLHALSIQKTTFEEIYSVPQSLFKLILQTAHLAAEVEKRRLTGRAVCTDHDELACTVKELEDQICTWEHYYHDAVLPLDPISSPPRESFPYHLVQAVYSALLIYFYRSVRDVNAVLLQPYVHQTIQHLLEYDKQKERYQDQSANTCWPGFIAGCESTKPQYQQQVSTWLKRSARSTGIRMFTVALEAVQQVWNARSCPGNHNTSWHSALREFGDLRVLVLS